MRKTLLSAVVVILTIVHGTKADDFRVESTVFDGKLAKPVNQSSTVFHAGIVYDYLQDPPQTAVLDVARNRYILLNGTRHERTEITLNEINVLVSAMGNMAEKATNGFLKFTAKPEFKINWMDDEKKVSFVASAMTYSVRYEPVEPGSTVATQYREFMDWTARLNAVMKPAVPPPFPRLAVNSELASRNVFPESVELTIPKQLALGGRGLSLRSEHVLTKRLLQKDLDQVANTGTEMASFKLVPFTDYRKRL